MISDCLPIARALLGSLPLKALNQEEAAFCDKYRPAFEIGRLAGRMAQGYYSYKAAIEVAKDPGSNDLVPTELRKGQAMPVGNVTRKDGTAHVYDIHHYLDYARADSGMPPDLERVWIIGALIAVGDALDKRGYLNRVPLLELLRHLRNGVAHGNSFDIRHSESVKKHPAHNRQARVKTAEFEIAASLNGQPVLFDFIGAADVLDLLMSVEVYLTRIRERQQAGELDGLLKVLP
jgi:hypothetical protein